MFLGMQRGNILIPCVNYIPNPQWGIGVGNACIALHYCPVAAAGAQRGGGLG